MTSPEPMLDLAATVLGAPYAHDLARFYADLLGWEIEVDEGDWVMLTNPGGGAGLSFQTEKRHERPVWPAGAGDQQMMMHLDIAARDLDRAVAHAAACGAVRAEHQPQQQVVVMIDPAGHPFCLFPVD
jgi:predicted enzyme related to lactoylglutathione lyase